MIFETVFTVRVVYKSGFHQDFKVLSFEIKGGKYSWTNADDKCVPIIMGVDEVSAVWQIGKTSRIKKFW